MRLRTLPLSLAGIVLGVLLAVPEHRVRPLTVLLLALTTVCLQILSNLSNELGDTLSGTDRSDRQGIRYSLQDGLMTISANYDESQDEKDDEGKFVYRERRTGSMSRSFNVEGIQEDGITAQFRDGVLRLELPKCEPEQKPEPRAIQIN